MKRYTPEEVDYEFGGVNELGDINRACLAKALSLLDKKIVDKITKEVYFFDGCNSYAFCLPLNAKHLKGKKSFIFLSDKNLKGNTEKRIIDIILHEVAHYYLNHKCLLDFNIKDTREKENQEQEADNLVSKWIAK